MKRTTALFFNPKNILRFISLKKYSDIRRLYGRIISVPGTVISAATHCIDDAIVVDRAAACIGQTTLRADVQLAVHC